MSLTQNQCGAAISPTTGQYYTTETRTWTETYEENYYNQVVSLINPGQPNPTTATKTTIGSLTQLPTYGCEFDITESEYWDNAFIQCFNGQGAFPSFTNNCTVSGQGSKTESKTYSSPATNQQLIQAIQNYFTDVNWGPGTATAWVAPRHTPTYTTVNGQDTAFYASLLLRRSRFRYVIPEGTNEYMRYKIKEIFTPDGYDAQDPQSPQPTEAEYELTWTGPGVEGDTDSWATAWREVLEPSAPGVVTIELAKYQCYTNGPWVIPD